MIKFFAKNKGVTLIELLVVLSIISILGVVVLSVNLFGIKSFKKGSNQAGLQQNVRIANEVIRKEVRNAHEISFLEKTLPVDENDDKVFRNVLKLDEGRLYHIERKNGYLNERMLTENVIEDVVFFIKDEHGKYILVFEIKATKDGEMYSLDNQIILYNLKKTDKNDGFIGNTYSIKNYGLHYNVDSIKP